MVWTIEWDETSYWTTSGMQGGAMTTTAPTFCEAKNVGRANETSVCAQVESEVKSKVSKQRDNGYCDDLSEEKEFEVSLANKYAERLEKGLVDFPYVVQPKLDGIRCYLRGTGGKVGMWSRKHKPFVSCPHIAEHPELGAFMSRHADLVLDGELYNHALRDDFGDICSLVAKKKLSEEDAAASRENIRFHCFDCFFAKRPELGYVERNAELVRLLREENVNCPYLLVVGSLGIETPETYSGVRWVRSEKEVEELIEKMLEAGFEGLMLKKDVPYRMSRSNDLLKYKRFLDAEYVVVGFEEGKGNLKGYATTVVARDSRGVEFRAGVKGDRAYTKRLLEQEASIVGKLCTVRFQELTPVTANGGGVPRFGKMVAIRDYEG